MSVRQILEKYQLENNKDLLDSLSGIEKERDHLKEKITELKNEIFQLRWMLEEHD